MIISFQEVEKLIFIYVLKKYLNSTMLLLKVLFAMDILISEYFNSQFFLTLKPWLAPFQTDFGKCQIPGDSYYIIMISVPSHSHK